MISEIRPKSHQQYTSLPILGPILDEFTNWSYLRGYSLPTVRNQLKCARWIDDFFCKHGVRHLSDITHGDFDAAWEHFRSIQPGIAGTVRQIEKFTEETRSLELPLLKPNTPADSELDRFSDYLRNVRGLQEPTIRSYRRYLKSFLEYISYDDDTGALVRLTSKEIEGFLIDCSRGLNRYSLQNVVGQLRGFLRFQHEQGVLSSPLHTMVDTPRVYRQERLPRSLPWETVEAILSSIDRTDAHGIRDYTILFLVATYGLRPCEVVSLTLDDIDWRVETIRIPQRKTGNRLILPLTDAAGSVLIEYLKKCRPQVPYRELFLRLRAPNGPLRRIVCWHCKDQTDRHNENLIKPSKENKLPNYAHRGHYSIETDEQRPALVIRGRNDIESINKRIEKLDLGCPKGKGPLIDSRPLFEPFKIASGEVYFTCWSKDFIPKPPQVWTAPSPKRGSWWGNSDDINSVVIGPEQVLYRVQEALSTVREKKSRERLLRVAKEIVNRCGNPNKATGFPGYIPVGRLLLPYSQTNLALKIGIEDSDVTRAMNTLQKVLPDETISATPLSVVSKMVDTAGNRYGRYTTKQINDAWFCYQCEFLKTGPLGKDSRQAQRMVFLSL